MDQDKRRKMIEELAYYRSLEQRGGDPKTNWLEAEMEVDRMLKEEQRQKKSEELAAFETLGQEIKRLLAAMKGSLPEEAFRQALDKATKEVKERGEFTSEAVASAAKALTKALARNIEMLRGTWKSVTLKTAGLLSIWSGRGAKFLKQAEEASESWLKQANDQFKPHTYHTGEITTAGTFVCQSCRHPLTLDKTGHLPRCPQCDHTAFKPQP